ncbi:MAG: DUF1667 domain-containing protein [Thaumarchaeota archaeon]|jgi:CxxC motif-containing protein|nr:DUF1667 domain-containing protein [Nitrososphaerota archaeon]
MSRIVEYTCIICPSGCLLRVEAEENRVVKVEGAGCPRGVEYAKQEFSDPMRIVFTVVRVRNGELPTVSVKTTRPIPKNKVFNLMKMLASIELEAPVEIGEIIVGDAYGAEVVATRRVGRREPVAG